MSLIIYLFEDHTYQNFYPLTYNRPVYELLFGMMKLREKVALHFPQAEIRLLCREFLKPLLEQKTGLRVNYVSKSEEDKALFLNGRVVVDSALKNKIDLTKQKSYQNGNTLLASVVFGSAIEKQVGRLLLGLKPGISPEIVDIKLSTKKIKPNTCNYC